MGWEWTTPWGFTRPGAGALPLTEGPDGWWDHELREGLRGREMPELVARRPELAGVERGIDRAATLSPLRKAEKDWDPIRVGTLHSVLAAAPRTQAQLHAANEKARAKDKPPPFPHVPSARCPWCDQGVDEDHR